MIVKKKLLYRIEPHNRGVVFAEPERARLIAKIHDAISNSRTWKEFRDAVPKEEYRAIISSFDEGEKPRVSDEFSGEAVPGWNDGDYPPWLQQEMDKVMPREVLEKFGTRTPTAINGNFWHIPKGNLDAICANLCELGFELELAQDLNFH